MFFFFILCTNGLTVVLFIYINKAMKNKKIVVFVSLAILVAICGVAFGGSNLQTFYNDTGKELVDTAAVKAREVGSTITENVVEFSGVIYGKAKDALGEKIEASVIEPAKAAASKVIKDIILKNPSILTEDDVKDILLENSDNTCVCE